MSTGAEAEVDRSRRNLAVGIALYVGTVSTFTVLDTLAKYLVTKGYPVVETVWARYVGHLALLVVLMPAIGARRMITTTRPMFQLSRAVIMLVGTLLFMTALKTVPLADAYAISFASPLIVTAMAAWILRERVGMRRKAAVVVGFAGVLIVISPGSSGFQWAMLLPLGMAFTWASFQIMTRSLNSSDGWPPTLFYTGLVGSVLATIPLPFVWVQPGFGDGLLLGLLGLLGLGSHYMLVLAYRLAPASLLAPFAYVQLPSSVLIGYLVFGDFPSTNVFIGAAVILGSGLYVFHREVLSRRSEDDVSQ